MPVNEIKNLSDQLLALQSSIADTLEIQGLDRNLYDIYDSARQRQTAIEEFGDTRVFYVNESGNNNNTGESLQNALRTLDEVFERIPNSGNVRIFLGSNTLWNGRYFGSWNIEIIGVDSLGVELSSGRFNLIIMGPAFQNTGQTSRVPGIGFQHDSSILFRNINLNILNDARLGGNEATINNHFETNGFLSVGFDNCNVVIPGTDNTNSAYLMETPGTSGLITFGSINTSFINFTGRYAAVAGLPGDEILTSENIF